MTALDQTLPGVARALIARNGVLVRLFDARSVSVTGGTQSAGALIGETRAARMGPMFRLGAQVPQELVGTEEFWIDGSLRPVRGGLLRLVSGAAGQTTFRIEAVEEYRTGELVAAYRLACRLGSDV